MNEAVFTSTETPQGRRFDVTPADAPPGSRLFQASSRGCFVLMGAAFVGIAAFVVLYYVIALVGALLPGTHNGSFTGLLSFAGAIAVVVWRARKGSSSTKRTLNRTPVSLLVNGARITREGVLIPASDIAELLLKHPNDRGGIRPASVTPEFGTSAAGAYRMGQRMGAEILNRSFALMVRRRSISTPEILVEGLTWNTGEALMSDVMEAME